MDRRKKIILAAVLHLRRNPCRRRRYWVHPIRRSRERYGEFHRLVKELRLDNELFQQYFRMPRELYLATGDSFCTIAFSYRVGLSTVCMVVKEVSAAIWEELQPEFMPAPSMDDWLTIAEGFRHRWNFPNCVGSVDGKHVVLQAPANSGSQFFNYKGTFSIVLLAVVDAQYLFRVVDVGGYGRTSDGGILWNSVFGEGLRDGTLDLPQDAVIPGSEPRGRMPFVFVGDEAFPLRRDLMRPYPGPHGPGEKRAFNYRLSRARLVVECAFGILSSQWRMYKRVMAVSPTTAETCVRATCVLHNFLRVLTLRRRQYQNQPYTSSRRPGDPDDCLRGVSRLGSNNATREALGVRAQFTSYFSEEGAVPWQIHR
ncbi:hypothetical protein ACEWY4_019076 [Coilia grayii]|uniref:DDE Tnp4 domain-containing protein n=1 Tax=Coilia grayii TaxID=363190 RepID=A0ABD1JG91_9TELE